VRELRRRRGQAVEEIVIVELEAQLGQRRAEAVARPRLDRAASHERSLVGRQLSERLLIGGAQQRVLARRRHPIGRRRQGCPEAAGQGRVGLGQVAAGRRETRRSICTAATSPISPASATSETPGWVSR
jgi:hypothetical protein